MRTVYLAVIGLVLWGGFVRAAAAEERRSDRIMEGVVSGLLGTPQSTPDAAYAAKERERLASFLQSGQYVTSRQGEPIDLMVLGIPLTRTEHVYRATPIAPSGGTSSQ